MPKIIDVDKIDLTVEETLILKDVSFTVDAGDYIAIVGANGSGKTSLVKAILGLRTPQFGSIWIESSIIKNKKISYISQQVATQAKNFPITVFEVVQMGLYAEKKSMKFYNKEDNKRVHEMLKSLNIEHLANQQITSLSGGERQRALLGRSLISHPDVIILDEPTSALDPEFRSSFYELIDTINQQGVTILIITHDLGVLKNYVNKVLVLDHQVVFFGTSEDFLAQRDQFDELGVEV
ncbi:MAG: metal ABC transporter ATP-binding protein [Erysipelothrix sp.]|nr:metal ABC transporter ATP-binding protein [Erysipelothrix sp.]